MSENIAIFITLTTLTFQIIISFFCSSQIITENEQYFQSSATIENLQNEVIQLDNRFSQLTSLVNLTKNIPPSDTQSFTNTLDLTITNN